MGNQKYVVPIISYQCDHSQWEQQRLKETNDSTVASPVFCLIMLCLILKILRKMTDSCKQHAVRIRWKRSNTFPRITCTQNIALLHRHRSIAFGYVCVTFRCWNKGWKFCICPIYTEGKAEYIKPEHFCDHAAV